VSCYALRNPDLLAGFCGGDPDKCQWEALLKHWAEIGSVKGREFGCFSSSVKCYAERYNDLRQGALCGGDIWKCDWHGIWLHWVMAGKREGRTMECLTLPAAPPPALVAALGAPLVDAGALGSPGAGAGASHCRITTPGIVWMVATPAEISPLVRNLNASECLQDGLFRMYRSLDQQHVLVETGRGRTRAAAAIAYSSIIVDPTSVKKGRIGWMNVGIAGSKTLPAGSVRGLLTVYDVNLETYSSFSGRAVEGVQTALGVSVTRPSEMAKVDLDAVFDTEAAAFFELGRMVAPTELLAAVKVVAIKAEATTWPSPTDLAVEGLIEAAWPKLHTLSRRMLNTIKVREEMEDQS